MSETLKLCETANLKPGDRVRSRHHPELVGTVLGYEWNEPGVLSAIPYNIEWDDPPRASKKFGIFGIYASDNTVERIPRG